MQRRFLHVRIPVLTVRGPTCTVVPYSYGVLYGTCYVKLDGTLADWLARARLQVRMRGDSVRSCTVPVRCGIQSRPTIKRTGENGDTVFLAPAATPASSLTAGNAKKCGLMYIVHSTGSFHAHAIPHWNTCRNLRSFLRCSARSAFAHSASA